MVVQALFALVLAHSATADIAVTSSQAYAAATMTDLPTLGTDRRVILQTMRHANLKVLESTGDHMTFDGGLPGWPGVTRATYTFANNALTRIELAFSRPNDDAANHTRFWEVRDALAVKHGSPAFDRVRDSDKHRERVLESEKDATIWTNEGVKVEIEASYGTARAMTVLVARDPHSEYVGELAQVTDNKAFAMSDISALTLATRTVAENLLDDFGDQQTIVDGAKKKGAPINVRLKTVTMPQALADNASYEVKQRFFRFADGDWDVNAVKDASESDVDLVIEVTPVANATSEQYQMRLSALVARGARAGQMLYTATMPIRQ